MTVDQVKAHVAKIAAMAGDDEAAHGEEDRMREEVLQAIADGTCEDPKACAAEALKSSDLNFARWCA